VVLSAGRPGNRTARGEEGTVRRGGVQGEVEEREGGLEKRQKWG